jgi:hypothetical protein
MSVRRYHLTVIKCDRCKHTMRSHGNNTRKVKSDAQYCGWKTDIPALDGKTIDCCSNCWDQEGMTA